MSLVAVPMNRWTTICAWAAIVVSPVPGSTAIASEDTGQLQLKVALVASDLSLKPVPKRPFVVAGVGDATPVDVTTNFDGEAVLDLPPGHYSIRGVSAVELEGRSFEWDVSFEITSGQASTVELSNDNASVTTVESSEEATSAPPVPISEGELFRRFKSAVFKVGSEGGHGTGFLVDPEGLILTNHHVVSQSDYLAVHLDEDRKYPAELLVQDDLNDVAVLRINPDVIRDISPLLLASDAPHDPPVSIGERILAIGSPLTTETILTAGLVSKIEEGVIYSDVSINPGNSGGPLFNMLGEVVGINTFGIGGIRGPGVSGVIRIHVALKSIDSARQAISESSPPPDKRLPVAARFRFPPDDLREIALATEYEPRDYHLEAGKIDVQFITPVVLASLEVEAEREAAEFREKRSKRRKKAVKEYSPGEGFYEWRRYAGDYRPVVHIQAIPEVSLTGGSAFAVMMLGPNVPKRYRFKTDFDRMELLRGDTVVAPIHPGRMAQVVKQEAGLDKFEDIGFYGAYEYPPEAFRPDVPLTLRVWQQGKSRPVEKDIKPDLQQRIWDDFKSYFDAFQSAVAEGP